MVSRAECNLLPTSLMYFGLDEKSVQKDRMDPIFCTSLVSANLRRVTSPPNSTLRRYQSYLLLYIIFIFYLPRCTLLEFPSFPPLSALPFLSYCNETKTTRYAGIRQKKGQVREDLKTKKIQLTFFLNLLNQDPWKYPTNFQVLKSYMRSLIELDPL